MDSFVAAFSRNLYIAPGGYYIAKLLRKIFGKKSNKTEENWKTISFRGVQIRVDVNTHMGAMIYWRGAHEWAPVYAIENNIKPGDTVLDIGASQGEYTLRAAKMVGKEGKVIAIEPLSKMFKQLETNINLNTELKKRVTLINTGLAEKEGKMPIYGTSEKAKERGIHEGMPTIYPTENRNQLIEEITLKRLDDILEKEKISKVDFIKIDVEGAELSILKGGEETLKKSKPTLLIESNQETFAAAGYTQKIFFDYLKSLGYNTFYKVGNRGKTTPVTPENMPDFCNVLAKAI
jgi:FkbM family methyltransferase